MSPIGSDGIDDSSTPIIHVDMDAFFAAVEVLRHPDLRGRPVVVGGSGARGVVAAASYEARAYGVHSAMPSTKARRLCPHAVFLPGDHDHYEQVSARVMAIFRSMTPLVEPLSLDEAFLDVGGARRLLGPPAEIARTLRAQVLEREGLTCSVGVARVKFLAKLASEAAKPKASPSGPLPGAGVFVVEPHREPDFLHPLSVRALWGVGPATHARLERLGVRTVGDLAEIPIDALCASVGSASGRHLADLARMVDPRPVVADRASGSIGHEVTFARDLHDPRAVEVELVRLADAVGTRLRAAGTAGRTVTLKVRFGDFRTVTRSMTAPAAISSGRRLAAVARELVGRVETVSGIRLLGIHVSKLGIEADGDRQLSFDDVVDGSGSDGGDDAGWSAAESAVDAIRARFGAAAVGPASLADQAGLRVARRGGQQWGPDRS